MSARGPGLAIPAWRTLGLSSAPEFLPLPLVSAAPSLGHFSLEAGTENKRTCYQESLASVARLVGRHPVNPKAAGSIPSQGRGWGCRLHPWLGVYRRQMMDESLSQ